MPEIFLGRTVPPDVRWSEDSFSFLNLSFIFLLFFFIFLKSVALWSVGSVWEKAKIWYEKIQHVCVHCYFLVLHSELISTPSKMRFQSTLAAVLLGVILFTSHASPAALLNEESAVTPRTQRKFELKEVVRPTRKPTKAPRYKPTRKPTRAPTSVPSVHPTQQPTATVEEQGPFSAGGGRNNYPVNLPATLQPTGFADVQPPHLGAKPWWIINPLLTPPVWGHY